MDIINLLRWLSRLCNVTQLFLLTYSMTFVTTASFPRSNESEATVFLQKSDHLREAVAHRSGEAPVLSENAITKALTESQGSSGPEQTGKADHEKLMPMKTSKYNVPDKSSRSTLIRRKRYVLQGSKWTKTSLTYKVSKYSSTLKDRLGTDDVVTKALKVWSDVSSLIFTEKRRGRVDIDIRFEEGEHGDGMDFHDEGAELAHAFFPQNGGNVHFDDQQNWAINGNNGISLFHVAVHEFGHALGVAHSDDRTAVMYERYDNASPLSELQPDDINAIQALYGTRENPVVDEPGSLPDSSDGPDMCEDAKIDAATRIRNGDTYFFRGGLYWKIQANTSAPGYPRRIRSDWNGLEGHLDAAFTWSSGKTFFFKGDKYWRFTNMNMDLGFPKFISTGFEGIPDSPDAAFVWSGNDQTYFFKGSQYWLYDSSKDPPVSNKYPKRIRYWKGLPDDIDAAFQWENKRTYFFKGKKFYRFNDDKFEVDSGDPPYPRPTSAWWFHCRPVS